MAAELLALGYLAKKALDKLEDGFTDKVIGRWSRFRARRFLSTFAEAVAREAHDEGGEEHVNSLLEELLSNETKTEVMFEAYRRVLLSASKELGPRIIALLTAQLLSENRQATDQEEVIFRAAESFTDQELRSFKTQLPDPEDRYRYVRTDDGGWKYSMEHKTIKVSPIFPDSAPIGPLNLIESLGSWAPKAIQIGLMREEIVENIPRRSGSHDGEWEREFQWSVIFAGTARRLIELIDRAAASVPDAKASL